MGCNASQFASHPPSLLCSLPEVTSYPLRIDYGAHGLVHPFLFQYNGSAVPLPGMRHRTYGPAAAHGQPRGKREKARRVARQMRQQQCLQRRQFTFAESSSTILGCVGTRAFFPLCSLRPVVSVCASPPQTIDQDFYKLYALG